MAEPLSRPDQRLIGRWLLLCCATLLALVMVGGATRLTGSGLSIVEWRPVTGVLPPFGEAAWEAELQKYRSSPEYQKVNRGMSIDEFKSIFWFEYWHRVLARLLGLLFALPLVWLWWRRRIPPRLRWPLLGILLLGAAQGYMGWFMVKSGLVDIPRVSPYRLAAHLSLALLIYAGMFWLALGALWPQAGPRARPRWRSLLAWLAACLVGTIIMGAFVAGLRAGYLYNTFPLMDGQWIPDGLGWLQPWWLNPFENPLTAQFLHRLLAMSSLALAALLWWIGRNDPLRERRRALGLLFVLVLLQASLGILTLLQHLPVWLGTLHQGGAVIVLSGLLIAAHAGRASSADSLR
jgi:cytochrome c oxidase assembly protein subunit 15